MTSLAYARIHLKWHRPLEIRRDDLMSLDHPAWCDRAECHADTAGYLTHSRTGIAQSPCGELAISVHLEQDGNAPPAITLTAVYARAEPAEPEAECELLLHSSLAREVGWLLLTAGRQAVQTPRRTRER
jgi:hypothetical protein